MYLYISVLVSSPHRVHLPCPSFCALPSPAPPLLYLILRSSIPPFSPFPPPSQLDLLTVSETAKEPPQDETGINTPTSLALETTYINQRFSQQMLNVDRKSVV